MEYAIQIKNLVKSYKDVLAVNDISFNIVKGKSYAFLGCNGAGKSTTINIIAGIIEKDSGEISIYGSNTDLNTNAFKQHFGLVFQNSVLDRKLSVKENLYNKGMLYGLSKKEILKNIENLSLALDFNKYLNSPIEKLSGGQARRIDLARALVHNPEILILDEPTTGLDPQTRQLVWKYINHLKETTNLTIVLTTHYMEEAADMDKVIIIDNGKILVEGTPTELKNQYASDCVRLYNVFDKESVINDLKSLGYTANVLDDYIQFSIKESNKIKDIIIKFPNYFNDFEVIKGKMDDVFLNVTGKVLEGGNV